MHKIFYGIFCLLACLSVIVFWKAKGSHMDYSVISLDQEIKISGLKTANLNPALADTCTHIADSWKTYFGLNLPNPARTFAVYTDYDQSMNYSMIIGSEFKNNETLPAQLISFNIPAGKYAIFTVKGKMPETIQQFWTDFWKNIKSFPFERTFKADFELYDERYFKAIPEADIYISIK